jgi:hypothetical protein
VPYGFDFLTLIPPLCGVVAGVELVGAGLVVVLGAADGVMVDGVVVLGSVVLGVVVLGLVVLGVVVLGVTVVSTGVVVVDGVVVLGDVVDGVTGAVVSTGVRVTLPADESRVTRAVSVVVVARGGRGRRRRGRGRRGLGADESGRGEQGGGEGDGTSCRTSSVERMAESWRCRRVMRRSHSLG